MLGDRLGELFVVFERSKKILTRTVTAKAEETKSHVLIRSQA